MQDRWMEQLRCPSCRAPLTWQAVVAPAIARGAWGTLSCGCARYPVIDDIPVLLRDRVPTNTIGEQAVVDPGPAVAELVAQVEGPDPGAALVRLLRLPVAPWPLGRIGPVRRALDGGAGALAEQLGERLIARMLRRRDDLVVEDWLAAFYLHSAHVGHAYDYFLMRWSQPRQLAFLALAQALPDGPVLDVGCGFGHVTWALQQQGHEVVGVDYNFAQLWVARWWMSPTSRFVCADASLPLPFDDGRFSAAWFADRFTYVPRCERLVAEMSRCAGGGPVFLPRFDNADAMPTAAGRTVEGWREALGAIGAVRLVEETSLVAAYLAGRGADLRADADEEVLRRTADLYAVVGGGAPVLRDHGPLPDPPPHAGGRLVVNPLYAPVGGDGRRFRLTMPSDWYAYEDGALTRYHAHQAVLTPQQQADLAAGVLTERLRPLVDAFVVIGVPDRYIARTRRRLKLRIYEIATAVWPRTVDIPDGAVRGLSMT